MFIIKRNGKKSPVQYDKITDRNIKLSLDLSVDTVALSQTVIRGLSSGMTTRDIDQLSCESAIHRSIYEPDYGTLALRIAWNDLHKNTKNSFSETIDVLNSNRNIIKNKLNPLISKDVYDFAKKHINIIHKSIDYNQDYGYSYFAFKTLEKAYLQKVNKKIVERPQDMLMRVNLGIHGPSHRNGIIHEGDIDKAIASYKAMSQRKFIHASPTLFNAGTNRPQMSSCFILTCPDSMGDDEYDEEQIIQTLPKNEASIPDCWKHCAKISKHSGGIGVDLSFVRGRNAYIAGTNGTSSGIIPLVRVFNEIGRYIDQGGKRKGAIALYLQPWHPDTPEFLEIRLNNGSEELKARDVFPAMWMPNLFFKRLETDEDWSFFCPGSYPELVSLYGEEFETRYIELEKLGKAVRSMKTSELWEKILKSLDEKGLPYMLAKDHVNEKSNQKNIGAIYGSNLCTEIMEYHDPQSIAVCNLASISLPAFVDPETKKFDFEELGRIVEMVTENLNLVLDKNYSPVRFCAENNQSFRPIGIGVQGLADVFAMLHIAWETQEAADLNKAIFECIYFYALKQSSFMGVRDGSYYKFEGSPASEGILQYDMWGVQPITRHDNQTDEFKYGWDVPRLNWTELKLEVQKGLRNSLLVAPMPTASTSQILGNNECFEPYTSNIYARKVIAGDFPLVNQHLYKDLLAIGKWDKNIVDNIIKNDGSVQQLDIPQNLKDIYKTVWEISQKTIIDMAADRGAFIDQSQSMNIHLARPSPSKLSSMYMYAWKKGLKTLSYYLRSQATVDPVKFTIMEISDPTQKIKEEITKAKENEEKGIVGGVECNEDVCVVCSG
jgi:ribonucleoside-diphosphate reductase alpha subunit